MGLEEDSSYRISVTATNAAGSVISNSITGITREAGENNTATIYQCTCFSLLHLAPSAAPAFVGVSVVTSSNITVKWRLVDCIHRNGEITGYLVRYGELGTATEDRSIMTVPGSDSTTTIPVLNRSTEYEYTVEVAAINSVGIGVYSAINRLTQVKWAHCEAI